MGKSEELPTEELLPGLMAENKHTPTKISWFSGLTMF